MVCRLCLVYNLTKFWLLFYWSLGVVVVCRLCLVYNLTKFWLLFYWSLGVAVLWYVDFVLCII